MHDITAFARRTQNGPGNHAPSKRRERVFKIAKIFHIPGEGEFVVEENGTTHNLKHCEYITEQEYKAAEIARHSFVGKRAIYSNGKFIKPVEFVIHDVNTTNGDLYDMAGLRYARHRCTIIEDDAPQQQERKPVLSGVYGRLRYSIPGICEITHPHIELTADEMREVAHTLNQIAETMEPSATINRGSQIYDDGSTQTKAVIQATRLLAALAKRCGLDVCPAVDIITLLAQIDNVTSGMEPKAKGFIKPFGRMIYDDPLKPSHPRPDDVKIYTEPSKPVPFTKEQLDEISNIVITELKKRKVDSDYRSI